MSANVIAMFDAALAAAVIRANPDLLQRGHIKQTEILKDLFEGHYESATTVAQAFEGHCWVSGSPRRLMAR